MINNEIISIIIPAYNAEAYIKNCLESIHNQTYKFFEVIVVDDGSSDNTMNIVENYIYKDQRFRSISKTNAGVGSARNLGMELAIGDFVCFVDSDDTLKENFLEKLHACAVANCSEITYCFSQIDKKCNLNGRTIVMNSDEFSFIAEYSTYVCWGAIYRKEILKNLSFAEDLYVGEDILFKAQAIKMSKSISIIYLPLYCYTVRGDSACHGEFDEKKYSEFIAWDRISKLYQEGSNLMVSSCKANLARIEYLIARYYDNSFFRKEYMKKSLLLYRDCAKRINSYESIRSKIKRLIVTKMPNIYFNLISFINNKLDIGEKENV